MLDFEQRLQQQITTLDMKVIKMIQGVTRWDRKRNEDLYKHSDMLPIVQVINKNKLRCFGMSWGEMGPTVEACTSLALPESNICKSTTTFAQIENMLPRKLDTSQSHTEGSFSGPALTIMSSNIEWLSAANQQLVADLSSKHQCAVMCMQETHLGQTTSGPTYQELT